MEVQVNSVTVAEYVYDGDGNQVKAVVTGGDLTINTIYIGTYYQQTTTLDESVTPAVETTEWEKYYYAGETRLAMREDSDNPLYLIGDHLGSTSLVIDSIGQQVAKQTYLPFGETWGVSAADLPTDFTFTGQREAAEIGLMYYVARWYDSEIGHFIQADSVIPEVQGVQSWNRYAYVNYSPLKYIDPSGHFANIVVGALIGGFVGGLTYAITNQGESFNWGEFALATGVGAGAGALISTGVGLALAATAGSTVGSMMTGAGAAMLIANESYMFENTNDFESDEFIINTTISGFTGGFTAIPGIGSGAVIGAEAIGSSLSYLLIEDDPTIQGVFWSAASGAVGGMLEVSAGQLVDWNMRRFDMKAHQILGDVYSANINTVNNALNNIKVNSETVSAIFSGVISAYATRNYSSIGELLE